MTLVVSQFEEGVQCQVDIPDSKGNFMMQVTARRQGDKVFLSVTGGKGNYSVENLGEQEIEIVD